MHFTIVSWVLLFLEDKHCLSIKKNRICIIVDTSKITGLKPNLTYPNRNPTTMINDWAKNATNVSLHSCIFAVKHFLKESLESQALFHVLCCKCFKIMQQLQSQTK